MPIRFVAALLVLSFGESGSLTGAGSAAVPKKAPTEVLAANARTVLAALVKAAVENRRLPRRNTADARGPFRRIGDDLTVYYVRAGAAATRRLPAEQAVPSFLLALGIALDDSPLLRQSLLTRTLWRKVETDGERQRPGLAILAGEVGRHVLGKPNRPRRLVDETGGVA